MCYNHHPVWEETTLYANHHPISTLTTIHGCHYTGVGPLVVAVHHLYHEAVSPHALHLYFIRSCGDVWDVDDERVSIRWEHVQFVALCII